MRIDEIIKFPICATPHSDGTVYPSSFRQYHILNKVMEWLEAGVPTKVIQEWVVFLNSDAGEG